MTQLALTFDQPQAIERSEPAEVKLWVVRKAGAWEVVGDPAGDFGPYDRRSDAEELRIGLERYARARAKSFRCAHALVTCEKLK